MQKILDDPERVKPWYKQFWPWFIISLPASAVIAGIITVFIAFENADSLVVDDYYKSGLAINSKIKQQQKAASMGFAAILRRLPDERLYLKFDNAIPDTREISLNWIHPADSAKDFTVSLIRQNDGSFQAKSSHDLKGRWYLRLSANEEWLLKSEIISSKDIVHLTPLLD